MAIIYSLGENKKKNCCNNSLIYSLTFYWFTFYLLIFRQNPMNFEWSTNSLTESYFTGVLFILLIATIYSLGENKKNNCRNNSLIYLLTFYWFTFYLLIFRENSMNFEWSLNSLTESYFTGELRLGESEFTGELGLRES